MTTDLRVGPQRWQAILLLPFTAKVLKEELTTVANPISLLPILSWSSSEEAFLLITSWLSYQLSVIFPWPSIHRSMWSIDHSFCLRHFLHMAPKTMCVCDSPPISLPLFLARAAACALPFRVQSSDLFSSLPAITLWENSSNLMALSTIHKQMTPEFIFHPNLLPEL